VTLSDPIYNLPGLTFQGPLDDFWTHAEARRELFRCFRNTVIHATQVNGGFYSAQAIRMAVANCRRFLEPSARRWTSCCEPGATTAAC
jgi:capsular polysaccharide export protein